MTEPRAPQQIAEEAERILQSEVFNDAIASIRKDAETILLRASGPDADATRREMANLINAVDGVKSRIQAAMLIAQKQTKPKAGVA